MFKVLCIDGGGIRGVFAARFLQLCEEKGVSLAKSFDLVVGTSTGGIIALAVAYEKSMAQLVELYSSGAVKIFPKPRWTRKCLWNSKYPNEPLVDALKDLFGSQTTFAVPTCQVRIPSYNLETGFSKIFRGGPPDSQDRHFFVWQVAAATSAAPIFFPAFFVENQGLFVDGGIWANNPSIVALTEAMNLSKPAKDIHILSIGLGEKIFHSIKPRTGIPSWGLDLVELVFRSQSDGVFQQCNKLQQDIFGVFHRVAPPPLEPSESSLDDIDAAPRLLHFATEVFEREWSQLEREFFTARLP